MATLMYDPSTGNFLNGTTVQAPATGDTVIFGYNMGASYTYTVPSDFPMVAEFEITSPDATVNVPSGVTLNAGVINVNNASDSDPLDPGGVLILGPISGTSTDTAVINTDTLNFTGGGHIFVADNATINAQSYNFAPSPGITAAGYNMNILNGASLTINTPTGSLTNLALTNVPSGFIITNNTGAFQVGALSVTPTQFEAMVNATTGSGSFTMAGTVGAAGQTLDTDLLKFVATFGALVFNPGTGQVTHTGQLTGAVDFDSPNDFDPQNVVLDALNALGHQNLLTGQSVTIENGMSGTATLTDQGGIITNQTSTTFNGPTFNFTTPVGGASQNLFSGEFVNTTFGLNSPLTITGRSEIDCSFGSITLDNQTNVTDATVLFDGLVSLASGGLLFAQDDASVTIQSDIVNGGGIYAAGGSTVTFEGSDLTDPGDIRFLGPNNGLNFGSAGVDPPTLIDFGDSDSVDIGSNIGGNSDFGPNSTAELSGSLLDVLNNAGTVIAAFTLQRTDGFTYTQSDFLVNTDDNGGTLLFTSGVPDVACFAAGTHILTAAGEVPVEELRAGDLVPVQVRRGLQPIVWIGQRRVDCRRHPKPAEVWPVRIAAHAFAPGRPHRFLLLSPDHAVFTGNALVPIRYLINGATIAQVPVDEVTYYHVELAQHEVLLAEGLACESYLETGNRGAFENGGRPTMMHPDFALRIWNESACAPLLSSGPPLHAARRRLIERLPGLGHPVTADPALCLLADGTVLDPQCRGALVWVALPNGTSRLRLRSRQAAPIELHAGNDDTRRLGVAVQALAFDGVRLALDDIRLTAGWHAGERDLRWTDGDACLDVAGVGVVELWLAPPLLRYHERPAEAGKLAG